MKSARDIVIQFVGQAVVAALVRYGVIPAEMQGEAQLAAIAAMPAIYRGLRSMDNFVGRFIRGMDEPSATPN